MSTQAMNAETEQFEPGEGRVIDVGLLQGLRDHKPEAFELLLEQFEAPLFRFFFYSHGNYDLAEDQCGDTFAELIRVLPRMRGGEESFRAFVFGVARNVMRRNWRVRKMEPLDQEFIENIPDSARPLFDTIARRDQFERALDAIRQFDEPARQVLLLRFLEEMTIAEISRALDLPLNTVKSSIYRGCDKLRRMFLDSEGQSHGKA